MLKTLNLHYENKSFDIEDIFDLVRLLRGSDLPLRMWNFSWEIHVDVTFESMECLYFWCVWRNSKNSMWQKIYFPILYCYPIFFSQSSLGFFKTNKTLSLFSVWSSFSDLSCYCIYKFDILWNSLGHYSSFTY